MAYWWVNHKQTFKKEFTGGYIWAPTVNKNGSRNQSYINLSLVKPGDIVFSYANTLIKAVGIVEELYQEATVPQEFGSVGEQWNDAGYLVKVNWTPIAKYFKPKDHISIIRDLLPVKYSRIQKNGDGNQSIYLVAIGNTLGDLLITLIQNDNSYIPMSLAQTSEEVGGGEN